jgi:hypothetical protein
MARTTENVCLTLRPEIVKAVDAARGKGRDAQSRSQFVDLTLERALSGQPRQAEPVAIADSAEKPK